VNDDLQDALEEVDRLTPGSPRVAPPRPEDRAYVNACHAYAKRRGWRHIPVLDVWRKSGRPDLDGRAYELHGLEVF